jgi:hypothetical protein
VPHEIHAAVHDVEASRFESAIDRVVAQAGGAKLSAGGNPALPSREPRRRINPVNVALLALMAMSATLAGIVPVNVALSALASMRSTLTGLQGHLHPAS